jgi:hypothetical protein
LFSSKIETELTNLQLALATNMVIFRQYVAPFLVLLVFFIALVAVSARIFLPTDMAAPAPIEQVNPQPGNAGAEFPGAVASLVRSLENNLA